MTSVQLCGQRNRKPAGIHCACQPLRWFDPDHPAAGSSALILRAAVHRAQPAGASAQHAMVRVPAKPLCSVTALLIQRLQNLPYLSGGEAFRVQGGVALANGF